MKRIVSLGILSFMIISTVSPFLGQSTYQEENKEIVESDRGEPPKVIIVEKEEETTSINMEEETTITYPNLYTDFTQEEVYMIQRVVETETYTADIESKMNVASVVFNRLNHLNNKYGDDIIAIITAPNQFAYSKTEISDTTIQAVENVYKYGDITDGCIAFRSDECPQYWYGWEYQFTDKVGHHFYKEVTEGE